VPPNLPFFSRWWGRRAAPFLIFALARSGSTTLRRLLACHDGVSCIHEPFNPDRRSPRDVVADGAQLRRELRQLRQRYDGIKHVWDPAGWPFPPGSALNQELVTQPQQRVLFLNRRNMLRRLVSLQMSIQAQAWGTGDEDRRTLQEFPFRPLDTEVLRHLLASEAPAIARQRQAIVDSGNALLDVWYEDVFDPETPIAGKEAKLATIFEFLGLQPDLRPQQRDQVRLLFHPDDGPLNSAATYRRIPGIDDVEARFGSDATGHLFH